MADIILKKPAPGTTSNLRAEDANRVLLETEGAAIKGGKDGNALVLEFPDEQSAIVIEDYYEKYSEDNQPSYMVDGEEVEAETFYAALGDPNLAPAAGPAAGADPRGGRYNEYGNSALAGGLDHLNRLDYESGRAFEWENPTWITAPDGEYGYNGLYTIPVAGTEPAAPADNIGERPGMSPSAPSAGRPSYSPPAAPEAPSNLTPGVVVPPAGIREPGADIPGAPIGGPGQPGYPGGPNNPGMPGGPGNPPNPNDPGKPDDPNDPNSASFIRAGGSTIVVDEGALAEGSQQHTYHGAAGTGIVILDVHGEGGGRANIALADQAGHEVTFNHLASIPVSGAHVAPTTFSVLNVNGVEITFTGASYNVATGKWTLDYEYRLTGAQEHGLPGGPTDRVISFGADNAIRVQVTDFSGDVATGAITVEIHDDAPVLSSSTPDITVPEPIAASEDFESGSLSGTFTGHYGADGKAAVAMLVRDGADGEFVQASRIDGDNYEFDVEGGVLTITANADGTFHYEFAPDNPNLTIENRVFDVRIVDSDKDTADTVVSINLNYDPSIKHEPDPENPGDPDNPDDPDDPKDKDDPKDPDNPDDPKNPEDPDTPVEPSKWATGGRIIVDEADMDEGTGRDVHHAAEGNGAFTVNLHGEAGTIQLALGNEILTAAIDKAGNVSFDGGEFTTKGVEISFDPKVVNHGDGTYTFNYSYSLIEAQQHGNANKVGEADALKGGDEIAITVTDSVKPDVAIGKITVEVHDDGPELTVTADTVSKGSQELPSEAVPGEKYIVEWETSLTGGIEALFGADGEAAVNALTINGQAVNMVNGTLEYVDRVDGKIAGVLHISRNADGSFDYEYEPTGDLAPFDRSFDVVATDGDGDHDLGKINVFHNYKPDLIPGKPGNPEDPEDPTPPESVNYDPKVNGLVITVDEAALPERTGGSEAADSEHGYMGTASFVAKFNGGEDGVIKIGDNYEIKVTNNNGHYEAKAAAGTIVINGIKVSFDPANLKANDNGEITIRFGYELTGAQRHQNAGAVGANDELLTNAIPVKVIDSVRGDEAEGAIQFRIHDDGPTIAQGANPETFGDDVQQVSFALPAMATGADVAGSQFIVELGASKAVFNIGVDSQGQQTFTRVDGDLNVTIGNGVVTYTRPAADVSAKYADSTADEYKFGLSIIDGDGDKAATEVLVRTLGDFEIITDKDPGKDPDPDPKPEEPGKNPGDPLGPTRVADIVITDDSYLVDGTKNAPADGDDNDAHWAQTHGAFGVTLNGLPYTMTIGQGDSTVELKLDGSGNLITATYSSGNTIQGTYGEISNINVQGGRVTYLYTQTKPYTHPVPKEGENSLDEVAAAEQFNISVSDGVHGAKAGMIKVQIEDDAPTQIDLGDDQLDLPDAGTRAVIDEDGNPVIGEDGESVTMAGNDVITIPVSGLKIGADIGVEDGPIAQIEVTVRDGAGKPLFTGDEGGEKVFVFKPELNKKGEPTGEYAPAEEGYDLNLVKNEQGGYELKFTRPEADRSDWTNNEYNFAVKVTDSDGDSVSDTVRVTTYAAPKFVDPGDNPDPGSEDPHGDPYEMDADVSGVTTDESWLATGTAYGKDAAADRLSVGEAIDAHSATGTGQFAVSLNGNAYAITIGSGDSALVLNFKADGTFDNAVADGKKLDWAGVTEHVIKAEYGEMKLTGEAPQATGDGRLVFNYTFEQKKNYTHGEEPNTFDQLQEGVERISLVVQDVTKTGADAPKGQATGSIKINIEDDAPEIGDAVPDAATVVPGITTAFKGNFALSFGADGKHSQNALQVRLADATDADFRTAVLQEDGSYIVVGIVTGADLVLTDNGDGTYGYEFIIHKGDEGNFARTFSESFVVRATDSDNDYVDTTIEVGRNYEPGVTHNDPESGDPLGPNRIIEMDDAKWGEAQEGKANKPGSGDAAHDYTGEGSFTVQFNGDEDGYVVLQQGSDAYIMVVKNPENGEGQQTATYYKAILGEDGKIAKDEDGNPVHESSAIEPTDITFTDYNKDGKSSVSVKIKGVETSGDGTWKFTYEYELGSNYEHKVEEDSAAFDPINITVVDSTGDSASGKLELNVHDDAPAYTEASYNYNSAWTYSYHEESGMGARFDQYGKVEGGNGQINLFEKAGFNVTGGKDAANNDVMLFHFERSAATRFWQAAGKDGLKGKEQPSSISHVDSSSVVAFNMTASTVHYQYKEGIGQLHVQNVIDIANLALNTGKALWYGDQGLTIGLDTHYNEWNKGPDGQISFNIDPNDKSLLAYGHSAGTTDEGPTKTNYEKLTNAYGETAYGLREGNGSKFVDAANISEAVVFDLKDIAYGMNLELGKFEANDRVVVTFLTTPPNNNDDVIVKVVEIDSENYDPDNDGHWHYEVPDGFTKVFVSSLRSGIYNVDENGLNTSLKEGQTEQGSGFTIRAVEFLTPEWNADGKVEAHSADGITSYEWNWEALICEGKETIHINGPKGGNYSVYEKWRSGDGSHVLLGLMGGKLNGQDLLEASLQSNGTWSIKQYREFELLNDDGLGAYRIDAKDSDGDVKTLILGINAEFVRFDEKLEGFYDLAKWSTDANNDKSSDVLVGTDANSLIYGKGGNDLIIADKLVNPVDGSSANALQDALLNATTQNDENSAGQEKVSKVATLINNIMNVADLQEAAEQLEKIESRESGDDMLYGGIGNDILLGAGGDDFLSGDAGKDVIFAGSGNDIIVYDSEDMIISGGSGIDVLLGTKNADDISTIIEGGGNKPLVSGVEVLLKAMYTDDSGKIEITSQDALVQNGLAIEGNAVYLDQKHWLDVSKDGDQFRTFEYYREIGEDGGPVGDARLQLQVMKGDVDVEIAVFGTDRLEASKDPGGNDNGENAIDHSAFTTDEAILGLGGDDVIKAGSGNDKIFGGKGTDHLHGGAGDDFLDGGQGTDFVYGGEGNDIIVFDRNDVVIDGGSGLNILLAQNDLAALDDMSQVQNIHAVILGEAAALKGLTSHDALSRLGVTVEDGTLSLGSQWNYVAPNQYKNASAGLTIEIAQEYFNPGAMGSEGDDILISGKISLADLAQELKLGVIATSERIAQALQDNSVALEKVLELIESQNNASGNDVLNGGSGDDILFGGSGDDVLNGGEGEDSLFAGSGNDILIFNSDKIIDGGDGIDILLVGSGYDRSLEEIINEEKNPDAGIRSIEILLRDNRGEDPAESSVASIASLAAVGIVIANEQVKLDEDWTINYEESTDTTVVFDYKEDGYDLRIEVVADKLDESSAGPMHESEGVELFGARTPMRMLRSEMPDEVDGVYGATTVDALHDVWKAPSYLITEVDNVDFGSKAYEVLAIDSKDILVEGGMGVDIVVTGDNLSLKDMLEKGQSDDDMNPNSDGPAARDVEVLIRGEGLDDISSAADLEQYGIRFTENGKGIELGEGWKQVEPEAEKPEDGNDDVTTAEQDQAPVVEPALTGTEEGQENGEVVNADVSTENTDETLADAGDEVQVATFVNEEAGLTMETTLVKPLAKGDSEGEADTDADEAARTITLVTKEEQERLAEEEKEEQQTQETITAETSTQQVEAVEITPVETVDPGSDAAQAAEAQANSAGIVG